jgi:hypothetical protein
MAEPRSPEPAQGARRRKAYLVATYTGELDANDAREPWFVYDEHSRVHRALAAELSAEEQEQLRPVRHPPPQPGAARPAPPGATDEELAELHAVSQGWHTPTDPATSATVHVRLIGERGDSGQHTLSHYRPSDGDGVFKPGSIDEFAISCEDLGDIHTLEVWHDNDGHDLQASRWKLDKVVITCIQTSRASGKGDCADETKKTEDSDQWHFVVGGWLGCTPADTSSIDEQLHDRMSQMEQLQIEVDELNAAKRQMLSTTVHDCEHSRAVIPIGPAVTPELEKPRTTPTSCATAGVVGVVVFLLCLLLVFSPTSDEEEPSVSAGPPPPPPPLPQCKSDTMNPEECDCELWAREEAAPALLDGLCASTWDEVARGSTWEAAEAHVRCTDCCEDVILPNGMATGFGGSDSSAGGSWVFTILGFMLCAVLVAIICTCDARDGGVRRRQIDGQLRAGWQGARRRIPPRRGTVTTVASPSRRGRSRSPTRRGGRSRSRSPGRPFASVSRDSTDSSYF